MSIIYTIFCALGTIPKNLDYTLGELGSCGKLLTVPKTALPRSAGIHESVQEKFKQLKWKLLTQREVGVYRIEVTIFV